MKPIALTLTPSPPSLPGGPTPKSRTDDDKTFAPALSHAVAKKKTGNDTHSEKLSRKTRSANTETTAETKVPHDAPGPGNEKITENTRDISSAPQTDKKSENSSPDTASEVDSTFKTEMPDNPETPPNFYFTPGASGDLFSISEVVPVSNLQITVDAQSAAHSKQDGLDIAKNLFQDTASLEKDTSNSSQSKDALSLSIQDAKLTQTARGNLGGQLNPFSEALDNNVPATGQITSNSTQAINGTGQDALLAQLQKIMTANGLDKSIFVQQPASQKQAAGLDALFPPLYALTDASKQPTTSFADASNDSLNASLSGLALDRLITGEKSTDRISSTQKSDFHLSFSKFDAQGEKNSLKLQEKEAASQDTSKNLQTALFSSTSSTDATGNSSQAGQFSFGSSLIQNMQTTQQPTGTTGSNYLPPWTASQENNLINQVTQHFRISSGSSTSNLTLKLYPEELGELKIDIQMKDGSIKASIVTQNEQVQQVLEKYIPKLRSFMEQQGLTVDDILVTHSAGNVGNHDLFQEDFVDNHNFSAPEKSSKSTSFADFSFEKDLSEKIGTAPGVNVTV